MPLRPQASIKDRKAWSTTLSATAVRIDGADDQPVQLDGDIVTHLPCDVVPAPHTVPLLVPHAYLDRARPSP